MKQLDNKWTRVISVIAIHCISFLLSYFYSRHIYVNGGLLSIENASQYLPEITLQTIIVTMPTFVMLILSFILLRKSAVEHFFLEFERKSAKIVIAILLFIYIASLIRQLIVYDDRVTVGFKWVYYFIFIAFFEEFEYRALLPAILKGHVNKYVEWLLPNILFAAAHLLMPMVSGTSGIELAVILLRTINGYILIGVFWEWCKRKSGSLWVGVLIHAICDFAY